MMYFAMTDKAVATELGGRLKALRLRSNRTQKDIAEAAGLSITAIQGAEKGETTLLSLIRVMRVLDGLDNLDSFLPEAEISPLQLAKLEDHKRKRASGKR
jgi:transcriptional regulator with XRE-family HTH domain